MSRTLLINPSALEAALIAGARGPALDKFAATGLPHRRMEAWKWTDIRAALADGVAPDNDVVGRSLFAGVNAFEITIMNGAAEWAGPAPAGIEIALRGHDGDVSPAAEDHPLAQLCAASVETRLDIAVPEGVKLARPIHLRHVAGGGAHHFWAQMRLGAGAEATLIESFDGAGAYFANSLLGLGLDEGARLTRVIIQDGSAQGVEASLAGVRVGKGAFFKQSALLLGAKAARVETRIFCLQENGVVELASASILDDDRHADQTSLVALHAPGAMVRQMHRSALRGRSRGVFQGKFRVARAGQKTDARMNARALLLNEGAQVNHKPELEIYADDVACGHGSTVGALDADALFYLQQRGLSAGAARALLVEAFIGEAFDAIEDGAIAAAFRTRATRWLESAS